MDRSGPLRRNLPRPTSPYSRAEKAENVSGYGLFSRVRGLFRSEKPREPVSQPRVPRVVSGRPDLHAADPVVPASPDVAGYHAHDLGMADQGDFVYGQRAPSELSTASLNPSATHTPSPNEALLDFFKKKGSEELSNMEVVGVLSLIGQAVSRNESVLDMSMVSGVTPNQSLADAPTPFELPSRISRYGDFSMRSDTANNTSLSSPRRLRSSVRRRKYLSSGPKPLRADTSVSRTAPEQAGPSSTVQHEPSANPRRISSTAAALLEILDEPKESTSSDAGPRFLPRKNPNRTRSEDTVESAGVTSTSAPSDFASKGGREPTVTSTPQKSSPKAEPAQLRDQQAPSPVPLSYHKYKPSKSSSLRNSFMLDLASSEVGNPPVGDSAGGGKDAPEPAESSRPPSGFPQFSFPTTPQDAVYSTSQTPSSRTASVETLPDAQFAFDPPPAGVVPGLSADARAEVEALKSKFVF